jgi:hypothetical protein
LGALLRSIACERTTIERFILALVVAAAVVLQSAPWDGDLGDLKCGVATVAHHLRTVVGYRIRRVGFLRVDVDGDA